MPNWWYSSKWFTTGTRCLKSTRLALPVLALFLSGCGGDTPVAPTPPPPTTANLTITLDAACFTSVTGARVFIDGLYVGIVATGSHYIQVVTIGSHNVEAAAYYSNGAQAFHWGPVSDYVPAAGYNQLFYCR